MLNQEKVGKFIKYFIEKDFKEFNKKIIDMLKTIKSNTFEMDKKKMKKLLQNRSIELSEYIMRKNCQQIKTKKRRKNNDYSNIRQRMPKL